MESNRLTILPSDSAVYRDQGVFNVDLSQVQIPENIHALQWLNGSGWIEYKTPIPNDEISVLPDWANQCVQLWEQKYVERETALQSPPAPVEADPV